MKSKQPLRWFVAGFLLTLACAALGAPQTFGDRKIEIPEPQGFVALSAASPQFMQMAQQYQPPGNRLVEVYTTPGDHAVFAAGGGKDLGRYLQLQTLRNFDGKPVSAADFADASQQMEGEFKKAFANIDTQATELFNKGNAALKEQAGVDPQIAASDFGYLGAYRREPWGMFFSISTKVAAGAATSKMICSGALALINHQLVYLYAYSTFDQPADRNWTESAVSAWADAVHAANPDDPALEASAQSLRGGLDWRRIIMMGIIGGCIGAIVSVIRKRRER